MEKLKDIWANIWQRLNRIRKELVTQLNAIGALLALYALANHDVHEKLLGFVPEEHRKLAAIILPIAWFWLVQKGKEIDKARTITAVRLGDR